MKRLAPFEHLALFVIVAMAVMGSSLGVGLGEAGAAGLSQPDAARPQIACSGGTGYVVASNGSLWSYGAYLSRLTGCADGDDNWVALAAGEDCGLALKSDGTLWSLGAPLTQVGTDADWVAAASGSGFNAALASDGTLYTWGANGDGQLGLGDTTTRAAPTQISGHDWVAVACGQNHMVAVKSDGSLWSWGDNTYGQLGLGDTVERKLPTQVSGCPGGDYNWASVACGPNDTVAVKHDGTLWAWGTNGTGQLGLGNTTPRTTPTQVTGCSGGDDNWTSVDCAGQPSGSGSSATTFAIKSDGTLWGWGWNLFGNLNTHDSADRHSPVEISEISSTPWAAVAADYSHTFGLTNAGDLYVWGAGHGSSQDQVGVVGLPPAQYAWAQASCGDAFTVGVGENGKLWSWGDNSYGQLGTGATSANLQMPVQVTGTPGGDSNWTTVACGAQHTTALKSDGSLWSWGYNNNGQLGDGTVASRHVPVHITGCSGGDTNWASTVCGGNHSAALKSDRSLWTWGQNNDGQLGDGTLANRNVPVHITGCSGGDSNWVAAACGYYHSAAVKSDGTLWVWGLNSSGQLGDGTTTQRQVPVQVTGCPGGDNNWTSVACGQSDTVALKSDGSLWAWGHDSYGQLGYDATTDLDLSSATYSRIPQRVGTDNDWAAVACGSESTYASKTDGSLWAWGDNHDGQLGQGAPDSSVHAVPVQVGTADDWTAVIAGGDHALALAPSNRSATASSLWAWGDNSQGELGDATFTERDQAVRVPPIVGAWGSRQPRMASGNAYATAFTAALKDDGSVWAWGDDSYGQLGQGGVDTDKHTVPQRTSSNPTWQALACGARYCVALDGDGSLWSWGNNHEGQLGDASMDDDDHSVPAQIDANNTPDSDWTALSCGANDTVALKSDGSLWSWGNNLYGQLGDGTNTGHSAPARLAATTTPDSGWVDATCGYSHTVAIKTDGSLWSWGDNRHGQLGDGTLVNRNVPVHITGCADGDSNWVALACGQYFTVALKSDGSLWSWGYNHDGQLGDGTDDEQQYAPMAIAQTNTPNARWVAVACGINYVVALKSDGSLWSWGANNFGQLGNGGGGQSSVPVAVDAGGDNDWTSVACGYSSTFAMKSDGSLWSWGYNNDGQLGNGSTATQTTPQRAVDLTDTWVASVPDLAWTNSPDPALWSTSNAPSFTWKIPTDESGISGFSYSLQDAGGAEPDDPIVTTDTSASFTDLDDGTYEFAIKMLDGAGNWSPVTGYSVHIDSTSPVTTATASDGRALDGSTWHAGPLTLTLAASDPPAADGTDSGVVGSLAATRYSTDGGQTWQTGQAGQTGASLSFARWKRGGGSGSYTVLCRSSDAAGNLETPETVTVKIDTSLPTTTDDAPVTPHAGPVTVHLTGHDAWSGIAATWYSLNGAAWTPGAAVPVAALGVNTIRYYSLDGAGNREAGYRVCTVTISAADLPAARHFTRPHPHRAPTARRGPAMTSGRR